jgi:AcrR family transcriptional regulator
MGLGAAMTTATAKGELSAAARHIARVAARLFATQGYDATSVRMIVEAAGVTKPTLYYHFGSKEGLAQALLTVPMAALIADLRAIVAAPGDPVEALVRVFEAQFEFCRDDPDRARFVFALMFGPQDSGLSGELAQLKCENPAILHEAVRRVAEAGVIAPERIDACATACRGMTVITALDFLYQGRAIEPDVARRLVDDLLRGFAAATPFKDPCQ